MTKALIKEYKEITKDVGDIHNLNFNALDLIYEEKNILVFSHDTKHVSSFIIIVKDERIVFIGSTEKTYFSNKCNLVVESDLFSGYVQGEPIEGEL